MDATRLASIPLFSSLSDRERREVAQWADEVDIEEGRELAKQGQFGYEFFVIEEGQASVERDGEVIRELGPGDFFGEIALLRDVPRTATVTARTDAELFALERDDFIGAVTGHAASAEAADAVVSARLGATPRPELGL